MKEEREEKGEREEGIMKEERSGKGKKEHKELLWRKVKGRGKGRRNYEEG